MSLHDCDQAKRALARCELVVSSDIAENTDTNAFAHILLPALGWGEKGGTITNSERRISRQRSFLPAPGEARADWRIICDVAQRMGYAGFDFAGPREIFDEHAQLSAWHNEGGQIADGIGDEPIEGSVRRAFSLAGLVSLGLERYDALQPVQWPVLTTKDPLLHGTARLFRRLTSGSGRSAT